MMLCVLLKWCWRVLFYAMGIVVTGKIMVVLMGAPPPGEAQWFFGLLLLVWPLFLPAMVFLLALKWVFDFAWWLGPFIVWLVA